MMVFGMFSLSEKHPGADEQQSMIEAVNGIRTRGCYCGRRYMEPVPPVQWNEKLYTSALSQAKDMYKNNFFAHYSHDGLNIGQRLERVGYNWMVAGENLGEGQMSFDEVMSDWKRSYSHCTMLMHPRVTEMGVAKVDKYWVQHFGKQMPLKNP